MGAGRRTQNFHVNATPIFAPNSVISHVHGRNLEKIQLGGVIFGCKNTTMKECLSKQLFGLPAQHFSYVKNIDPGLPLFLFNYSDRKIHGIFEAASKGEMYIDPHAWSADFSERTQYPAQVQIRVRLQCQPLSEDKFRQIIGDNYYIHNHFWFELDHRQANKLISSLVSLAFAPGNPVQHCLMKYRTAPQSFPSHENRKECEPFETLESEAEQFTGSSGTGSTEMNSYSDEDNQQLDSREVVNGVKAHEENLIYMKLKELALGRLMEEVEELTAFKKIHTEKNCYLEQKLMEATLEIQHLKDRCSMLESTSNHPKENVETATLDIQHSKDLCSMLESTSNHPRENVETATLETQHLKDCCSMLEYTSNHPKEHVESKIIQPYVELHLDPEESLFLIGGFDGESWLSAMDMYYPSQDVIKSLKPMSSVRSYSSVVQLNGEIYVFGGGNGDDWFNTVESYSPFHDKWTLHPPLTQNKGSLAGASLNCKIFAVGGGNGLDSFSDVEMFDLDIGRWISTRSMQEKRFALAAAELNGVIYATGGYNGDEYLKSAERFDPREHSWMKLPDMSTKRGCHSMVVLNEKLYALAGFDGNTMVTSIEVFDPRLGAWMMGEPMNHQRGYFAAAVVKESIYVIGGVKVGENIVETVENYKEGQGWQETCTTKVGKRCFLSCIAHYAE